MNEQQLVKDSLLKIFKQCGYADAAQMTQRHFEHIAGEIEKKSAILISGTTIKRLSNGDFSRLPQIATLNAIATYFDFNNWQDFKSSVQQQHKTEEPAFIAKGYDKKPVKVAAQWRWALLLIPALAAIYFLYSHKSPGGNYDTASFSAHKNTKNDLPNTVVFDYNIDNVNADSFFIQQSWDRNRRIPISKKTYTATDIYYEPGYHIAKLIANDSIIRAVEVSIPTNDWFFFANEYKIRYNTEYIKTSNFIKNGSLAINEEEIRRSRIDPAKEKIYLYSFFPEKLLVSSDNYSLKTRLRMKEITNNFCPYITLEIYCQRYFMLVKSTPKGCANEAMVLFGEKELSGKQHDLAAISYDVTSWTNVELTVKNKHVVIKVDGKECFSTDYIQTGKLITGLAFISNGLCEVDHVELSGLDGTIVCKDDFERK